jgi:hypothetical protein
VYTLHRYQQQLSNGRQKTVKDIKLMMKNVAINDEKESTQLPLSIWSIPV